MDFSAQIEQKGVQVAGGSSSQKLEMVSPEHRNLSDFNRQIHQVCSNIDQLMSDILQADPSLARFDTHMFE